VRDAALLSVGRPKLREELQPKAIADLPRPRAQDMVRVATEELTHRVIISRLCDRLSRVQENVRMSLIGGSLRHACVRFGQVK